MPFACICCSWVLVKKSGSMFYLGNGHPVLSTHSIEAVIGQWDNQGEGQLPPQVNRNFDHCSMR